MTGWISLHRRIREHWLWKDPVKFKWWVDILLSVNNTEAKVNIGNKLFDCKRGQSVKSYKTWGEEWKVSKDAAKNFFRLLESDGMVKLENLIVSTRITVCNYDSYQVPLPGSKTQGRRKADASNPEARTNNNDNNENNNYIYTQDFFSQINKELESLSVEQKEIWDKYNQWYHDQNFKNVPKLKDQLSPKQLLNLSEDYGASEIKATITSMENYKKVGSYISVFLTLKNWLPRNKAA